jgi:hypothetical protein
VKKLTNQIEALTEEMFGEANGMGSVSTPSIVFLGGWQFIRLLSTERVAAAERARFAAQVAAAEAEQSRLLTEAEMRRARERIDALKARLESAQAAQGADPLIDKFKCVSPVTAAACLLGHVQWIVCHAPGGR